MNKPTTKRGAMEHEQALADCRTLAVDLAKHVFQIAGEDASGRVIYEARLKSREAFWRFVQAVAPGVEILLEPGPGAQAWAREFLATGKAVRLLPAQWVAKHRCGAKNDRKDT